MTGTLTFSDIQDHSHYSASSSGIGGGFSVGTSDKSTGKDSASGKGGVSPMLGQSEGGDQSATTRSAVAVGTITVTNAAGQTQDVAGLSRDTSGTNGSVSKTPDVQKLLSQQADTMNAAQAAGQTIAQAIGDYASSKYKEAVAAKEAAEKAGDSAGVAAAQTAIDEWKEGGDYRVAMHTAGGALIGGLGGNALGGALGAGVSVFLAGKLNDLSQSIQKSSPTGNAALDQALGNIIANVAATGAGALVGGSARAATASNADLYNRQMHPDEKQKLAKLQQGQTPEEQQRLADAACYLVQCAAQLSDNDPAKAAAQDSQNRGAGYVSEQRDLRSTGQFVYDPIVDAWADTSARAADWIIQEAKSAGRGAANMGSLVRQQDERGQRADPAVRCESAGAGQRRQ
ncbi:MULTISPECIES: hypothetical protein [unclassified Burkholderia]|uniref:hypothetical protein n=1 Tax=unclassified Burkholderia TaxID=2613784 RepID=UPI001423F545|nr:MULTISPECIES: hypothetical protein [unclassified Burkholderia]NIE85794.1 hypothetical protein [Burkholderia sp. Tr-860]NIF64590.1 hypothetical protein [Burkholderia sp. Cy-647]NIF95865.1 hypothetical protein [Burkholderia sp. Ax-1720]